MENEEQQNLWTEADLASFLQCSVKKLRRERVQGVGFPYFKLGTGPNASVRYYLPHVMEHLNKMKHVPSVAARIEARHGTTKAR